jgi:hypothetical protein
MEVKMKKVLSLALVFALVTTMLTSISTISPHNPRIVAESSSLNVTQMVNAQGGLSWGCWVGIGGLVIATAGAAAATGGIGVFIIGQLGLYSAAAGAVAGCING